MGNQNSAYYYYQSFDSQPMIYIPSLKLSCYIKNKRLKIIESHHHDLESSSDDFFYIDPYPEIELTMSSSDIKNIEELWKLNSMIAEQAKYLIEGMSTRYRLTEGTVKVLFYKRFIYSDIHEYHANRPIELLEYRIVKHNISFTIRQKKEIIFNNDLSLYNLSDSKSFEQNNIAIQISLESSVLNITEETCCRLIQLRDMKIKAHILEYEIIPVITDIINSKIRTI